MISSPTQRYQARPTGQTVTTAFNPATTLAAGSLGVLCVVGGSSKVAASVADSLGNPWGVDTTDAAGAQGKSFASCQVVTPVTPSDLITVTWSNATASAIAVWLQEVTGILGVSAFDKTATNNGTSTTPTSGSTGGPLSQADEIAFSVFRNGVVSTWTKGAAWSNVTTPDDGVNCGLEYLITSSPAALNADGTWGTSGSWSALTATYKGAPTVSNQVMLTMGMLGTGRI